MSLHGNYRDSIETCRACHGIGTLRRVRERDFALEPCLTVPPKSMYDDTEIVTCWFCGGVIKWRKPGTPWTKMKELPRQVLEQMVSMRPWFTMDEDKGKIRFIAAVPLETLSPDGLLHVLKSSSLLGDILESHGWVVGY